MKREEAKRLLENIFQSSFNDDNFLLFIKNLLGKSFIESIKNIHIDDNYKKYFKEAISLGEFNDNKFKTEIFVVHLTNEYSFERARKTQRDFIALLLENNNRDAAIVAYVSPNKEDWRLSLVKISFEIISEKGNISTKTKISSPFRWSFLLGKNEKTHTAQKQFLYLFKEDNQEITLEMLENAFSVEAVTEEFFKAFRYALKGILINSIDNKINKDKDISEKEKHSYSLLFLSRLLFIYFLQKKGWFKWYNNEVDKEYIKNLWKKYKKYVDNGKLPKDSFHSIILTNLFFRAFNNKKDQINNDPDLPDEFKKSFILMPYLNGGLFSENELDSLNIYFPDSVFKWLFEYDVYNNDYKGFLETYNFTIVESSPIDIEVAVDPEMLGKVYESLISEEERGTSGIFYTPRVEIDFMCKLSLVEFLCSETNIEKNKIIDLIFDFNVNSLNKDESIQIREKLEIVKIVDPAVGSGSFLVGMMNILIEVHSLLKKFIDGEEENIFALKNKIIRENLYGVDVKDWAVTVSELRLWLSLVIESDEKEMDIYQKPLLPNLNFKIRQGDSLIEEVADTPLYLRGENKALFIPTTLQSKIRELGNLKIAFCSGQERSNNQNEIEKIENLEKEILIEIIDSKIKDLEKKSNSNKQAISDLSNKKKDAFGNEDIGNKKKIENLQNQIEQIEKEIKKYNNIKEEINKKSKKSFFLWEINFAEILLNDEVKGFDIVIGNPPYVRQELIAPPIEKKENYNDDKWRKIKNEYKEKLINAVKNLWGNIKIDKKSDLYVYFYYNGLSLLKEGGIFCFINSNSWLDVGYGSGLQEFLLKNMRPIFIIDNLKKRSFKQADVNTVIVVIQRPERKLDDYTIKFIAFKKPFEEVNNAQVIKKIEKTTTPVFDDLDCRIFPKTKKELLLEGVEIEEEQDNSLKLVLDPENLPYIGNKWGGKYLRAPEIYFKILEKGKGKLVRLGDIAEVRRGFTTGANEFFYLKPVGMTVKEVAELSEKNPEALIRVKNSAGWEGEIEAEFLKPVIKSPRELKTIIVKLEDLNYLVFMCHKSKEELENTQALKYIKWGEQQEYQNRPTCRGRERWWDLGEIFAPILSMRFIDITFVYFVNIENFFVGDTFFVISNRDREYVSYYLNSSCGLFFTEFIGRKNMGEGVLLMYGPEISNLSVIKPQYLGKINNLEPPSFLNRKHTSIFTELGFDPSKPIREQEPNPLPDRKALDDIVFDALGLTEEERKEVYWAVAELVQNRLRKAKSV